MYTNEVIQSLKKQLDAGELSAFDCSKKLLSLKRECSELNEECNASLMRDRHMAAELRMQKYKSNPEWYELRLAIQNAWRNARPLTNENVRKEILYLSDRMLKNIDMNKLNNLNLSDTDVTKVYEQLEDLILIPRKP